MLVPMNKVPCLCPQNRELEHTPAIGAALSPVVSASWPAATAVRGAAGAATGSLVGALTQAGVSDDAPLYAEEVPPGRVAGYGEGCG